MEFTLVKTGNFKVHELFTDSDGAKVVLGNVELRIYRKVAGVAWQIYDWNDSTFKSGAPGTEKDDCTVITAGAVATGLWQNDTPIAFAVFVAGDSYVFEFFDADNSVIIASSGIQYSGKYGDIAQASIAATQTGVSNVQIQVDKMNFTGNDIIATLDSEKVQVGGIDADAVDAASVKADAVTKIQNGLATGTNVTDAHSTTDGLIGALQNVSTAQVQAACEAGLAAFGGATESNVTAVGALVAALQDLSAAQAQAACASALAAFGTATESNVTAVGSLVADLQDLSQAQAQAACLAALIARSVALVGSKMDLDDDVAKDSGKALAKIAGAKTIATSGASRIITHGKIGEPGTPALVETIAEDGTTTVA